MPRPIRSSILLAALAASACTLHSTATEWHRRVGIDGNPVFLATTTIYGLNLLVLLPFVGDTRTANVVDEATARIAAAGSDRVRVVETEFANYWFALPPLSWLVTPVSGSVSIEYTPSTKELVAAQALAKLQAERAAERREQDHSNLIPEPRR